MVVWWCGGGLVMAWWCGVGVVGVWCGCGVGVVWVWWQRGEDAFSVDSQLRRLTLCFSAMLQRRLLN